MDRVVKLFGKKLPHAPMPSPSKLLLSESCMLIKAHGLHNLDLCKACNMIDIDSFVNDEPRLHLRNCFDLLDTAEYCRLCAYIAQTVRGYGDTSLRNLIVGLDIVPDLGIPLYLALREGHLQYTLGLDHLPDYAGQLPGFLTSIKVFFTEPRKEPITDLSSALRQNAPSCFPHGLDRAVASSCPTNDPSEDVPYLPLRVLDVGDGGEFNYLRLHISERCERGRYATLSYRWGSTLPMRTTRRTLKSHSKSLESKKLPQTFRDAIEVTRCLGIRYLWIDALCIVQDDEQDWLNQAKVMGSIYEHSSVTIATHSARDCHDGFLWRRQTSDMLEISPKHGRSSFWIQLPALGNNAISEGFTRGQIAHRAWIYQELCLSKRIIHFVEDRIIWDCHHRDDFPEVYGLYFREVYRWRRGWQTFVELYSTCQITKVADKLPAIAGIAQAWSRDGAQGDTYHSGIFVKDWHESLLWFRKDKMAYRLQNVAPSWSWASVSGETGFVRFVDESSRMIPSADAVAFVCGCGSSSEAHFTCKNCCLRLYTLIASGIQIGWREKSKRFQTAPSNAPRHLWCLHRATDRVGWAVLDDRIDDDSELQYAQVAALVIHNRISAQLVLVLRSHPGDSSVFRRVGMACIFRMNVFEDDVRKSIAIL